MHVQFERREHRVPAGGRAELRAAVVNDDRRLEGLTYDVETVSDPATEVRWAVSGPSSLEPRQHATIVVTLQLPASTRIPGLTVRLTMAGAGGRLTTAAETVVIFGDDRCAAFAAAPSLTLSADGSVTGSLVLVNCGPFKISLRVSARCDDGTTLTIDRPEVTLAAGNDPISVTVTMRRSDGRRTGEHEQVRLELISDGVVLASTQAGVRAALRPPPRHGVARVIGAAAGAVLLIALAVPVIANWLGDSPPADVDTVEGDAGGSDDTGANGGGNSSGGNGTGGNSGGDSGGSGSDDTAATIDSFAVTFLPDQCATALEWTVTEGADTTLVRRLDNTETDFGRVDSPFTDNLSTIRDADGGLAGVVSYELIARAAGGSDSRTEQVEVRCELPDLVVADIGSGVTVTNVGDGPAGPFAVDINDSTFDSGGLAVGDSEHIAVDLCEGSVNVVVDPTNAVVETDETNNEESTTIIC
jgi:uncharacterized membrane protein YgcG